ncbi:hypothetical protein M409DRAFT_68997 [Zasmidium cellare ATCC 36951]|uniref:DUF4385 multi-domain protein n=1 Tax=Zasmidium cellare ATCC 36951 TaxID=1080233 RepID=A0A6A6C6S0_ZASCE|nr:uncharacterized protein M409DRAFT_68997 [Zasmidium cellare ATCC 36951]KAF2162741.1 hypothetical protein M409DRAFT_68997 [Zasmidium cellare ATCC 36951]
MNNPPPSPWPTPALDNKELRMSYNIARGEQGVLKFEPYKSILLPHWRFRTVPIAEESSQTLWTAFEYYVKAKDFVGADMARKFIQMGTTRAKRYANHAGGRKYDRTARQVEAEGGKRTELAKSKGHKGQEEKLAASEVFREVWKRCTSCEGYGVLREEWKEKRKDWEKGEKEVEKEDDEQDVEVKEEEETGEE